MPWTRKRGPSPPLPSSRATVSNSRMNSSPMILRLASGSVTPASASKNRSWAFTWISSTPNCRVNVSSICSPSSLRISPVSTKTQVSWSPTALVTSAAATAESTPPESAQSTFSSPTCARIAATWSSMIEVLVQVGGICATWCKKLASRSWPRSVWATSGWNCTACSRRVDVLHHRDRTLGRGAGDDEALGRRGDRVAVAHPTGHARAATRPSATEAPTRVSVVRPYSPTPVLATSPPSCWAISCAP